MGEHPMTRQQVLLAILAAAEGRSYTPVQIQKAVFLVSRNLPHLITDGEPFAFVPYDYGPFDSAVYDEAERLASSGLAAIVPSGVGRWNIYSATEEGVRAGIEILASVDVASSEYISNVSQWVRSQGFGALVRSVYEAYPEMRANSIFQG